MHNHKNRWIMLISQSIRLACQLVTSEEKISLLMVLDNKGGFVNAAVPLKCHYNVINLSGKIPGGV